MKRPYIVLAVPHNTVVITCDSTEVVFPGNSGQQGGNTIPPPPKGKSYYYLFKHDPNLKAVDDIKGVPQLTGSDLKLSGTRQDFDPITGEPVVLMQARPKPRRIGAQWVRREIREAQSQKRKASHERGFSAIGAPGFEPGTSCPPDKRANQAAPRPVSR